MMRKLTMAIPLALGLGCQADVGEGKVKAELTEVPQAAAAPSGEVEVLTEFKVDISQSKLSALGAKITATHPIEWHDYQAAVGMAGEEVRAISYTAQMASLTTDHPKLQKHLLNEDFFEVEKFPTSTFVSSAITAGSEVEGMTHTVSGDMTIRGKSKRITFPAKFEVAVDSVKANTEFVINRQDFDIAYPGKPDDLIQDNVVLTLSFVAPRP